MSDTGHQFRDFFQAIHGDAPFPWQERLAEMVCTEGWPDVVALPTGSGKTACLDIAVFALAHAAKSAARRVFYVVDRRLVVDEAHRRMLKIRCALAAPTAPALERAAAALRAAAHEGADQPLAVGVLRGGAFRDESWVRTPLQPTLIASTVDQLGSRLLFRGYGLSPAVAPIHAALAANDALVLLDEAHGSRAFAQTLARVRHYCALAGEPVSRPLQLVEMTATPSRIGGREFRLAVTDRTNETIRRRLHAPKPVALRPVSGKKDDWPGLATALVKEALALTQKSPLARRVAIICNRVRTARAAFDILNGADQRVTLVTGRMRPLDRDDVYVEKLAHLKSGEKRDPAGPTEFVVATQTLEVGADLDFDVLVSEAASLDALLQRFGRLNRTGDFSEARGAIVAAKWQLDPKADDAVYGKTIAATWAWLQGHASGDEISMQIEGVAGPSIPQLAAALGAEERANLARVGPPAPVLLPAHLDALAQTSPPPSPEPDVALFLHGQPAPAECYIVWRGDLTQENRPDWRELLEFCPPLPAEALPVRPGDLARWLAEQQPDAAADADIEGLADTSPGADGDRRRVGVIWRNGEPMSANARLRPGDYLVLPATENTSISLGQIPPLSQRDVADRAHWGTRRRPTLRLHQGLKNSCPHGEWIGRLLAGPSDEPPATAPPPDAPAWLAELLAQATRPATKWSQYPDQTGWRARVPSRATQPASEAEIHLDAHLRHVAECAAAATAKAGLPAPIAAAIRAAAARHDWGKADRRFQQVLRGGIAGRFHPVLLAKGISGAAPGAGRDLPKGFRHEILSLALAEKESPHSAERELVLHLIASHHGRCRPLAPVVSDPEPTSARYNGIAITADERRSATPAHAIDSGVADRFWSLTERFGWWGLAYLEAVLRLADWQASDNEASEVYDED